ncbi:MAG: Ku protein [Parvularculaceae bacterium]
MAGRAYWKGYLKLSLVACPVKLYSAIASASSRVSFNMIHKDTRNRVMMKYHDPELGEVDRADLVKGYQFEKDKYVVVTPEELDEIQIESSKTVDIDGFVDASDIDPIYLDTPYYMAPDGPVAEETYAVILEAMKATKKAAIARIVIAGRERLVAIQPKEEGKEKGFVMTTLRSGKEVKEAADAFETLKSTIAPDMLAMARQIIGQKEIDFDPRSFVDRYEEAVLTLVKSKIAGGEPIITKAPERGNVINLMDALKRSIEEERRPPAPSIAKAESGRTGGKKPAAPKASKAPKRTSTKKASG